MYADVPILFVRLVRLVAERARPNTSAGLEVGGGGIACAVAMHHEAAACTGCGSGHQHDGPDVAAVCGALVCLAGVAVLIVGSAVSRRDRRSVPGRRPSRAWLLPGSLPVVLWPGPLRLAVTTIRLRC